MFWLGRYMERAENLARILDVNKTFARDHEGEGHWRPIVQLFSDEAEFDARHDTADAETVTRFYILDSDNPSSVMSTVGFARENARTLRHLISTEMWSHLNVFYRKMLEVKSGPPVMPRLTRLCNMIKENCQTHYGITEGTLYRDQTWYFYNLGRMIERADQTTRLLDMHYHSPGSESDAGAAIVASGKWNAVLRSVAGYHAFRRVRPRGMKPAAVAEFMIFDESFPRSLALSLAQVDSFHLDLEDTFDLRSSPELTESLERLGRMVLGNRIDNVLDSGLHEFLDLLQQQLILVTEHLGRSYFGHDR